MGGGGGGGGRGRRRTRRDGVVCSGKRKKNAGSGWLRARTAAPARQGSARHMPCGGFAAGAGLPDQVASAFPYGCAIGGVRCRPSCQDQAVIRCVPACAD
ncbi:hypothetical protein GQ55_3G248900 [Panicum hallii var. hallii]|uniref:Uncharacterized protein n=1 Tax=Panicum hallii var. hallii TaxID=1504633 RepID=A0A2T7ED45_9POAL|nr:hypothetical protein GQ55_3G248900 [Panicum hallii var. hallii]